MHGGSLPLSYEPFIIVDISCLVLSPLLSLGPKVGSWIWGTLAFTGGHGSGCVGAHGVQIVDPMMICTPALFFPWFWSHVDPRWFFYQTHLAFHNQLATFIDVSVISGGGLLARDGTSQVLKTEQQKLETIKRWKSMKAGCFIWQFHVNSQTSYGPTMVLSYLIDFDWGICSYCFETIVSNLKLWWFLQVLWTMACLGQVHGSRHPRFESWMNMKLKHSMVQWFEDLLSQNLKMNSINMQ